MGRLSMVRCFPGSGWSAPPETMPLFAEHCTCAYRPRRAAFTSRGRFRLFDAQQASQGRTHEPFVDADRSAEFLMITRRRVLEMARAGEIPAHAMGEGKRKMWRFRLPEL